jgi:translation initiation factor 2 subunit 1
MPHKAEFPQVGDLVVCSVENVKNFGAFVKLDEYEGREGFIHVRDVATGWVKYVRDHVREGQKIVCKVQGVDREKGHIDLSLKQVNDHQRREKIQDWKNEKKAEKLLEIVGQKMGKSLEESYDSAGEMLIEEYGALYSAFEEAAINPESLKETGLDKKWMAAVLEVAKENIQLPSVMIDGTLDVSCPGPDGVDHVKKALATGMESDESEINISYVGAPKYRVTVTAEDYKIAEEELKESVDRVAAAVAKFGGSASFKRKEEK